MPDRIPPDFKIYGPETKPDPETQTEPDPEPGPVVGQLAYHFPDGKVLEITDVRYLESRPDGAQVAADGAGRVYFVPPGFLYVTAAGGSQSGVELF